MLLMLARSNASRRSLSGKTTRRLLGAARGMAAKAVGCCRTILIAVSRPSRRWMRLARLLVTCLAFVLARPAAAEPGAFDGIVLVAGTRFAAEVPSATEETSSSPSRVPSRRTPAAHDLSPDDLRAAKLPSPRARIARKYLRHCALLC